MDTEDECICRDLTRNQRRDHYNRLMGGNSNCGSALFAGFQRLLPNRTFEKV